MKQHPARVEDYLEHIAEAIEHASTFIRGIDSVAALERDDKTQAAVVRCLEIIGEAANRIRRQDPEFVKSHPDLPWDAMRGMRNRIIHDYFNVNLAVVWQTVRKDLPKLREQIATIVKEHDPAK